jgi:hypothetical protein
MLTAVKTMRSWPFSDGKLRAMYRGGLEQVPGGRPHIPVDRRASAADFTVIAARYPVFRVVASAADVVPPARSDVTGPPGP